MTPERWQRIGVLFDRALAEPDGSRRAAVLAAPEHTDLKAEVLSLIEAHDRGAGFIDPPGLLVADTQVGAYRIRRILGRGGMGVVYLADDSRLHRPVALKALPPHLFRDEHMRSRLRREAQAAAALSHPSIATIYALEEIDDQLFIASEYLEGQTLREVLSHGPLTVDAAMATAVEIAGALATAHEHGVVHRDIKPENIIRTVSGLVKVLDFGLAQMDPGAREATTVTALTDAGGLAGTPLYMAPEQLLGEPTSHQTDQFAFGVVLYELVMGRHPFGTGSLPAIIARVLATEPDGPSGFDAMPDSVWLVVRRCLQKQPTQRFEVTAALVQALEDTGVASRVRPTGSGRRHPSDAGVRASVPGTAMPPRTAAGAVPARTPDRVSEAAWWWQFHQVAVTAVYGLMLWPAWIVHGWMGAPGVAAFLGTLMTVISAGSLRLHLWFTARAYPAELAAQRARVGGWVRAADAVFTIATVATGLAIAGAHTGWGGLFVAVGSAAALAALVIEPTTARAVFHGADSR